MQVHGNFGVGDGIAGVLLFPPFGHLRNLSPLRLRGPCAIIVAERTFCYQPFKILQLLFLHRLFFLTRVYRNSITWIFRYVYTRTCQ